MSHRLLLVEGDQRHQRAMTKTLRALVGQVASRADLGPVEDLASYDLVVANYDQLDARDRQTLLDRFGRQHQGGTRLLVFSAGKCKEDFVALFSGHCLTNLVAKNDEEVDAEELIVTTRKILDSDIFGLEKYFIWGIAPLAMSVRRSSDKEEVLSAAEEYARSIGVQPRFVSQFCSVADEFITNALYNAPVDGAGTHRFAHIPRSQPVELDEGEEIEVKLCCDGRRLGISTTDPFGSLSAERLMDYLAKCMRRGEDQIDRKSGGAGLGFYTIFDSLSHFVVNLCPRKRTEMVGIIDIRGSYKEFSSRTKSFNIFFQGQS